MFYERWMKNIMKQLKKDDPLFKGKWRSLLFISKKPQISRTMSRYHIYKTPGSPISQFNSKAISLPAWVGSRNYFFPRLKPYHHNLLFHQTRWLTDKIPNVKKLPSADDINHHCEAQITGFESEEVSAETDHYYLKQNYDVVAPPTDKPESWASAKFEDEVYYQKIVDNQIPIDEKVSVLYTKLFELFNDPSNFEPSKLDETQKQIDGIMSFEGQFYKNVQNKYLLKIIMDFNRAFQDAEGEFKRFFDMKVLNQIMITEFLKVYINSQGVDEFRMRSNIARRLRLLHGFKQHDLTEIEAQHFKEKTIVWIMHTIIAKSSMWTLESRTVNNRKMSFIVPVPKHFSVLTNEAHMVSLDWPRIVKPIVVRERLVRNSPINNGVVEATDPIRNVAQGFSNIPYVINKKAYRWFRDNESFFKEPVPAFQELKGLKNGYCVKLLHGIGAVNRAYANILTMASLYLKVPAFYFEQFIDWRGRFYCTSHYLGYQSHKLSLALLEFKHRKPLGSLGHMYLMLYGANLYGVKESHENRLNWVHDNHCKIIEMDMEFLKRAKQPVLFVAFCLEYRECMLLEDPTTYESGFPVVIDCTCSGMQHLAALVRDSKVAVNVNMAAEEKVIQDLYQNVAVSVSKKLAMLKDYVPLEVTRDLVKKVVMTTVYNVSEYKAATYFINGFVYDPHCNNYYIKDKPDVRYEYKQLYKIGKCVFEHFYDIHPKFQAIVQYFKLMSDLMSFFDCPISWNAPSGLKVQQCYTVHSMRYMPGFLNIRQVGIRIPTEKIDKKKQRNALMPNFVHSLDASNIVTTAAMLQNHNVEFFTVHDSFASVPANVKPLSTAVKSGFVQLYINRDIISDFHTECLNNLKSVKGESIIIDTAKGTIKYETETGSRVKKIPDLPEMGDFDIKQVSSSLYFVS